MFAERLKEARKAKRYSQAEVSRMLGVTQQAVGKWETGRSTPDPQTVARLAEILDTPTDVLLGLRKESGAASAVGRNAFSRYTESQIPVVGTVRAGYGALAFEEDYGKEYACVKDPENYFFLVVKGDSMEPRFHDGDILMIQKTETLELGEIGVVIMEGEGYVKQIGPGQLISLNPRYAPIPITDNVCITGRVTGVLPYTLDELDPVPSDD